MAKNKFPFILFRRIRSARYKDSIVQIHKLSRHQNPGRVELRKDRVSGVSCIGILANCHTSTSATSRYKFAIICIVSCQGTAPN